MGPSRNIIICLSITLAFSLIFSPTNAQKTTEKQAPHTTPYKTVNNFCLHKRLDVNRPFCLRVLKNPRTAHTKPDNFIPLLEAAINSTSIFVCKTITTLQRLYETKETKPELRPAVEECLSNYEEIAGYITNVISDASQESTIVGFDGEVIQDYINSCVKAMVNIERPEISDRNEQALNYAKLVIDIADKLSSRKFE